jgi:hypothetical protein
VSLLALFAGPTLHDRLEKQRQLALERIKQLDTNVVLNADLKEIVEALVGEYVPEPLNIDFSKQMPVGMREMEFDVASNANFLLRSGSGPKKSSGFRYEIAVPYTGDSDLFSLRPSRQMGPGAARGFLRDSDLVMVVDILHPNADQVSAELEQQRKFLQTYVAFVAEDLGNFTTRLTSALYEALGSRRERLAEAQAVQKRLGIPLFKHPEALEPAPVERKPLGLKALEEKAKDEPGYVLEEESYEQVVEVLLHFGKALERTPRTFTKLHETELRDFLLVILNSTFDGAATGEAFNGDGKTDVLVKIQDRNVFIGECKIWKDEGTWAAAIDQLLGYVVWRDTKAALILFIKDRKGISAVITKAEKAIRDHDCFVCGGPPSDDRELRRDFVVRSRVDKERLIQLAFLPFVIPEPPQEDEQAPDAEATA